MHNSIDKDLILKRYPIVDFSVLFCFFLVFHFFYPSCIRLRFGPYCGVLFPQTVGKC